MEIQTTRPQPGHRIREGFRGQRLTVLPKTVVRQGQGMPVVGELFVTDIGHYPSAPGHYVDRPHGRGESILIYCTSGSGWCELGGKEWRAQEGWALFITPETPHVYGADAEDPWAIWWVHFGGPLSAEFLRALGVTRDEPLLYAPETLLLAQAFEETYAHLQDGYIDNTLLGLSTGLTRVLGLLKTHQRAPHARRRRGEENIYRSIRYMREHIDRPQRLSELAELLGLTVPHYGTLFSTTLLDGSGRQVGGHVIWPLDLPVEVCDGHPESWSRTACRSGRVSGAVCGAAAKGRESARAGAVRDGAAVGSQAQDRVGSRACDSGHERPAAARVPDADAMAS